MRTLEMNKEFIIILTFFCICFFACKSLRNYPKIENYKYLKKEKISNYDLISYSNLNDTILIVLNNELSSKCGKLSLNKTELSNYKRIEKINENIGFYYKSKTTNGIGITIGAFEPGQVGITKIYSYSGMPYLIEKCN